MIDVSFSNPNGNNKISMIQLNISLFLLNDTTGFDHDAVVEYLIKFL